MLQYFIAFLEGIITFISPCLLPMLPIYASYFAGGGERNRKKTLIGALGARLLRRIAWLVPLPTVLANTLIVPFVLAYGYRMEEGIAFLMLTVGIGEILSAYLLGLILLSALKKHAGVLFRY